MEKLEEIEAILDNIYYDRAVVRKTVDNVLKLAKEKDKSLSLIHI